MQKKINSLGLKGVSIAARSFVINKYGMLILKNTKNLVVIQNKISYTRIDLNSSDIKYNWILRFHKKYCKN